MQGGSGILTPPHFAVQLGINRCEAKIKRAQKVLGTQAEAETIERTLEEVVSEHERQAHSAGESWLRDKWRSKIAPHSTNEVQAMETTATISTEQILSAVNQLSLPDLEKVFDRVLRLQAERKAPHLPDEEASLLTRSLQGLPSALRSRTNSLRAKREDGSITDAEYEELTQLTLRAEELHAERMEALLKLARLRGLSLPAILDQLGLHFPENG